MKKPEPIYLDNNATTAVDPRLIDSILEDLRDYPGNPSSIHQLGQANRSRLIEARDYIAKYLKVRPKELIFTSSGTEAINMVIRGLFSQSPKGHILTSATEHSAVYATVKSQEERGCTATYLKPGPWGAVTLEAIKQAVEPGTKLIALMAANNETGVKTEIESIAKFAAERHIPFLVDAVAVLGREPFSIPFGVSAAAFSGHKFHATKGCGLAYIKSSLKLKPLLTGGEQEFGKRGGTENVMGIMAFANALKLFEKESPQASLHMQKMRDLTEFSLLQRLPGVLVNGEGPRVVNVSNLSFSGVEGELLLISLDRAGIAVSHGSACSSGALEPSRILLNMGLPMERVKSSIRISLSRFTTEVEILSAIDAIVEIVTRLRTL